MVKNCDRELENHADPNPSSYNLESTFKSMGHIFFFFIHKLTILIFCEIARNFKLDPYGRGPSSL